MICQDCVKDRCDKLPERGLDGFDCPDFLPADLCENCGHTLTLIQEECPRYVCPVCRERKFRATLAKISCLAESMLE